MTELDLFYKCVPGIAKIIVDLRERTADQWQEWKRACLEDAGGLNSFAQGFIRKVLIVIDKYLEKESDQEMKIDDIKIYPCFTDHPPKAGKMERKEQYFMETGLLQSPIILNSDNYLIDGYTSYLVAKHKGIRSVPVRYGKRQIMRAYHKQGGRLYDWELPQKLIDRVSAGDKVLIHTQRGIRTVRVAAVEEYAGHEQKPLRMVIKVKRKCSEKGGVA